MTAPRTRTCAVARALAEVPGDQHAALLMALTNEDTSTREAGAILLSEFGVTVPYQSIADHRRDRCAHCAKPPVDPSEAPAKAASTGLPGRAKPRMMATENGGVVLKDVPLYTPLLIDDDLSPLLVQFGLNPDRYEVERDTFSSWMQSASDGEGGRDLVYLYSAKFRRVGQVKPEASNRDTLERWRSVLMQPATVARPAFKAAEGTPGTYALWPSDLQLGKPGTAEAVENFQTGIREGLAECQRLVETGVPIEGIHIGWGGDETEGVCNNYANQSYLAELNLAEQLELDTDLRIWAVKEALALGLPLSCSSVVSNHGEWSRNGSKDVETTKSDNASTHIARQVKRLFDELEPHTGQHIDWTIGGAHSSDPGLVVTLSGEPVYTSHGHIEKGSGGSTELRTKNAIEKQLLGDMLAERRLLDVRLFVMAHYHHHYLIEDRGRVIMGLPALEAEGSSDYMRSAYGVWSPSGVVGMVVGKFDQRPYRHLNVFGSKVTPAEPMRGRHGLLAS